MVGYIATRCLDREEKGERKERKYKGRGDDWDYKKNKDDKAKKSCYIVDEEIGTEFESNDDEFVYVAMKEDYDEDEKTTLISYVKKKVTNG